QGTTHGTVTNADGKYSLSNIPVDATLVFSFVGMRTKEILVTDKTNINVTMQVDAIGIEEVVAIGYGTMKKSDLTGAVVSADIEAFRESPNVNIMQSLQGAVPGIQIGQVDQAGEEPSIQIRGVNTLSGNKSPLIVVDEIIYRGRIGDLNPSDIESIEVLKDASSKAIYGSQAANGVILITTKSGKKSDKPMFHYSGSASFQNPTVDARLLNREENLEKIKGIYYTKAYLAPDYTMPNPDFDWATQTELVPALLEGIENETDFDWYQELTSPAYITDHLLSINGGTEKTNYYISGGYTKQDGYVINDHYERYTTRINFKNDITNWFTIGVNTFGSFTDFSGIGPGGFIATSPFVSPYDENGELLIYPKGESTTHLNPLLNIQADHKQVGNNISGLFYSEIKIPQVDGLTYRINYNKSLVWSENATGNQYGAGLTGTVSKTHASRNEETLDNILTYEKQLNAHRLKATLVYGYRKAKYDYTEAGGQNIPNISLSYNSLQQAIIQEILSSAWDEASLYQMARMNYNYRDRYLITGTFRRDGFSGFAKNNKFAVFPSFGLGWVLSNESFFNVPKIDYFKLRMSYGQNGNQTSRYSSLARVAAIDDNKYVFGDGGSTSMGQSIVSLSNDDLNWEKTLGLNFGIDFGILDNRIKGNIEYYKTSTTDLLWNMVIPEVTGFSSITTNIGKVANSGLEFLIEAIPIQNSNFSWDFAVNFSTNKNEIVSLLGYDHDGDGKEDDLVASGLFIGKSIGAIYHYEIDGIWQVTDDIANGYYPGNYRIIDQNDEGKISAATDRVFLGRTEPAFIAGIQNNLNYKNFTLRFFINTIQGGKDGYLGRQYGGAALSSTGNFANTNHFTFFDHWSVTNPDGKYAVTVKAPQIDASQYCSRSFIRLQDVSLAYRLDQSLVQNIGIAGAKLYISGKNLLTFTNWDGWDPETNQGIA
nr:SusC/RagA family TonB-linked outer membrane protein [Sunxiuqinia sp.]